MEDARSQVPGARLPSRKRKADATGEMSEKALDGEDSHPNAVRVPVNEDFLFDVDIEARELAPVYWLGPVYEGLVQQGLPLSSTNLCQYGEEPGSTKIARICALVRRTLLHNLKRFA